MSPAPILIVDDNATNLRLETFILERAGHEIRGASDADEAMRVLETFRPRLILMDLQLPVIDGFELTRRLRKDAAFSAVRIVALTAYAMAGDEERARAAGCDGYITKPVPPEELRRLVEEHLLHGAAGSTP